MLAHADLRHEGYQLIASLTFFLIIFLLLGYLFLEVCQFLLLT